MKLITFITLLLLGTSAWAANPKAIAGYAGETTGGVAFAFNKLGQKRKLVSNTPVYEGETLITSKTANSSVIFTDGTTIELNPSTQFRVEEFRYGKEEEKPSAVFRMLTGGFRFISGLVNKKGGNLSFKTPTATIGIRGSAGSFSADGTIEVYEGTFTVTPSSGGASTSMTQGETANTASGAVKKAQKLTKAQIQSEMNRLISLQAYFKSVRGYLKPGAPTPDLDKVEKAIAEKIKQGEVLLNLPTGGGSTTSVNTASPSSPGNISMPLDSSNDFGGS